LADPIVRDVETLAARLDDEASAQAPRAVLRRPRLDRDTLPDGEQRPRVHAAPRQRARPGHMPVVLRPDSKPPPEPPAQSLSANKRIAVSGGFMSVAVGVQPRVDTIGVFNSGVNAPTPDAPPAQGGMSWRPTTDALKELHGPALFINGHERDFLMGASRENFDLVNHVPAFYGARHNAGHTATVDHPGGGEFANVASNWLRYQFKGDREAAKMFVGEDCSLCTDPNWDTAQKNLK